MHKSVFLKTFFQTFCQFRSESSNGSVEEVVPGVWAVLQKYRTRTSEWGGGSALQSYEHPRQVLPDQE